MMVDVGHRRGRRLRDSGWRALRHLRWCTRHGLSLRRLAVGAGHRVGILHLLRKAMTTTRAVRNTRVMDGLLESVGRLSIIVVVRVKALGRHTVHILLLQCG